MAYCSKCGTKNEDDAEFCKQCGTSLYARKTDRERAREDRCEEDCIGSKDGRGWSMFWGVIIILIGLLIIFEFVVKNIAKDVGWLQWVNHIQFGWIIAAVIGLFIILWGFRVLSKK